MHSLLPVVLRDWRGFYALENFLYDFKSAVGRFAADRVFVGLSPYRTRMQRMSPHRLPRTAYPTVTSNTNSRSCRPRGLPLLRNRVCANSETRTSPKSLSKTTIWS